MKIETSEVNQKNALEILKKEARGLLKIEEFDEKIAELQGELELIRAGANDLIRLEVHSKSLSAGLLFADYVAKDLLIIALEQSIERMKKKQTEAGENMIENLKDLLRSL